MMKKHDMLWFKIIVKTINKSQGNIFSRGITIKTKSKTLFLYVRLRSAFRLISASTEFIITGILKLDVKLKKWETALDLRIGCRFENLKKDTDLRIWKKGIDLKYRCLWHRNRTWIRGWMLIWILHIHFLCIYMFIK